HQLFRAGKIPGVPIYIDSPLAVDATQVFRMHPELFDPREQFIEANTALFDFSLVRYVRDVAESKALNSLNGPAIIIAASGMAESGRILHHLANRIGDHRNIVLFVGFQAAHTLGRRIQEGQRQVKIMGEMVEARAEVETIGGYSAHADRSELRDWVRRIGGPVKRAFVVHGEEPARQAMAKILQEEGVGTVVLPELGQGFEL
ncbi:MAG TPA: MBL fold metallo-hydrolase RNA specificity domain-containing protein, partial [Gemmatimonadales bacterium]|nr:MBL fold metallo-hydrolase RNA specificity domain-containing protein [Gemmatimonadales bacterium]